MKINNNITNYRILRNMTRKELAEETGISERNIINIENGGNLTLKNAYKIKIALQAVNLEELFYITNDLD